MGRVGALAIALALALAVGVAGIGRAADGPAAVIQVTSATAGSSIGRLVEGRMKFRDREYVLTLHGVAGPAKTTGSVYGLTRARDIAGYFKGPGQELRNASGVVIR